MIKINDGWIGINTLIPNRLAFKAINDGLIERLKGYTTIKRELVYGDSRIDLMLENEHERCFVEVKNVSMKDGMYARFPDAVTTRGKKHLNTLIDIKSNGMRAVMLYIIQRMDVEVFGPATTIDPEYAKTLNEAYDKGQDCKACFRKAKLKV